MLKHVREFLKAAEALGLTVVSIRRSKHFRIRLRNKAGDEYTATCGLSESDHRAVHNTIARLRRFSNGETPIPHDGDSKQ